MNRSQELRRSSDRVLDTAEGVLIALRRYSLNQAFFDLAQTAKRAGVAPVTLADALVTIAQNQPTGDCDRHAVRVAREAWGALLQRNTTATAVWPINGARPHSSGDGQREAPERPPAPSDDVDA